MNVVAQPESAIASPKNELTIKVFGVGSAGTSVIAQMVAGGLPAAAFVAVNTDSQALAASPAAEKVLLETKLLRGLGTAGDPARGRALAEEHAERLKSLCQGADVVFVLAGLGGGAGTGISPVLARLAKETGALVLGFVMLPFDCEGSRRQRLAQEGLEELKAAADGVICLPNQKVCKLIDENTSVLETFRLTNDLLADGARAIWRLLTLPGLIPIHFDDLCGVVRDRHAQSTFAVAETTGPTRSREVVDKLLAHPLLDSGKMLSTANTVLVSLMAGPNLTMAEVNRVMEQINSRCAHAQVIMGAAIDESFRERLAVTVIAAREATAAEPEPSESSEPSERPAQPEFTPRGLVEELDQQLIPDAPAPRSHSRIVPPAPTLSQEKMEQMLAQQQRGGSRLRKALPRMRQEQLPLELVSKGRFDKSEPTIHKGEDLDVPTYLRRGVSLN